MKMYRTEKEKRATVVFRDSATPKDWPIDTLVFSKERLLMNACNLKVTVQKFSLVL